MSALNMGNKSNSERMSFETVLAELLLLEKRIYQHKLRQFIVFNKAYFVVTKIIKEAAENNYFDNPHFIEKLTVCFAQFYFNAVNDTVAISPQLPEAWALMQSAAQSGAIPNFIFLLMGANAHINHDLPLALLNVMGGKKMDELFRDVLKIDKLLMKSGKEILNSFSESSKLIDLMKRRCIIFYYRPVMYLILYWRIIAWRSYKTFIKNDAENQKYKLRSIKIAHRLLKLGVTLC